LGRCGKALGLLMFEEFAGEVAALHDQHDFSALSLREHVEATEQHRPLVDQSNA
jgi:hypothetical protein